MSPGESFCGKNPPTRHVQNADIDEIQLRKGNLLTRLTIIYTV